MKKIAIIGAGVVGATAAYYLSKEEGIELTVFDEGLGQATKAAAGIICPWFSKRRHKAWYRLARMGADFYTRLLADLEADGMETAFYQQSGLILLKKDEAKLQELLAIGQQRRQESPLIGELGIRKRSDDVANLSGFEYYLWASGAARVDGALLVDCLLRSASVSVVKKKVRLGLLDQGRYQIDHQVFDGLILASGAWLGELLEPLGYQVDVSPQKGQLRDYYFAEPHLTDFPLVMPEGELDIIPFANGKLSIGASHENHQGFDLAVDEALLQAFEDEALLYFPKLIDAASKTARVGIRAYTSDFAPFFGEVPGLPQVYAASGLGSSGLTTGPLLGKALSQLVSGHPSLVDPVDYPIKNYISQE